LLFSNEVSKGNGVRFPLLPILVVYHFFFASLFILETLTLYGKICKCHGEENLQEPKKLITKTC
jgi:hypothetical protein